MKMNGDGTVWVSVTEFASKYNKPRTTIYKWVEQRFLVGLGFIVHRHNNRYILIGIPRQHELYRDFAG